jgi:hypothetical protein
LHSTKWSDGKKKKGWKPFPPKNNLIQDSEGNEENGYPILDSTKIKINDAKEPNDAHKNSLKEEILHIIIKRTSTENRERILKAVREKKHNIQR